MNELFALATGASAVVAFVGVVGRALFRADRVKNASIETAWAAAREELGGAPPAEGKSRQIEYQAGSSALFLASRADVGPGGAFALCVIGNLHKIAGAYLSVKPATGVPWQVRFTPFAIRTGDAAFDRQFTVHADPGYLADAFLDAPTRALIQASRSPVEGGDGRLRMRAEGEMYEARPIVALARSAERLAERWNHMIANLLGLAGELGFEPVATSLSFAKRLVLGQAVRHGHAWQLDLVPGDRACEIVLHTEHATRVELRFPWPGTSNMEIASTFAAKESTLAAGGAYR